MKLIKIIDFNLYQPMKFIETKKRTKHATKNYPSLLKFFFYPDFLNSTNKTITPKGANIPTKKAFLGKSSATTIL